MSYTVYKFLHLLGIFLVLLSLGGALAHRLQGGTKANFLLRKKVGMIHGVGLTIAFIAGFGLMARGGFSFSDSGWIWVKLLVWLGLGAFPALIYKPKIKDSIVNIGLVALLVIALYVVEFKPF